MRRIARGSGTDVKDVENLIKTYNELKKNIKRIKRIGIPIKLK
jgi:signal recognition particle GTPase